MTKEASKNHGKVKIYSFDKRKKKNTPNHLVRGDPRSTASQRNDGSEIYWRGPLFLHSKRKRSSSYEKGGLTPPRAKDLRRDIVNQSCRTSSENPFIFGRKTASLPLKEKGGGLVLKTKRGRSRGD